MATAKVSTKVMSSNVTPLKFQPSNLKHTAEETAAQTAFVESQMNNDRIAQLRAEQKRIADELKSLKAAKPNRLEAEIARQIAKPNGDLVLTLRAALRGRLLYGQDEAEAIDGIVAQVRELLETTPADQKVRKMPVSPFAKKAE